MLKKNNVGQKLHHNAILWDCAASAPYNRRGRQQHDGYTASSCFCNCIAASTHSRYLALFV